MSLGVSAGGGQGEAQTGRQGPTELGKVKGASAGAISAQPGATWLSDEVVRGVWVWRTGCQGGVTDKASSTDLTGGPLPRAQEKLTRKGGMSGEGERTRAAPPSRPRRSPGQALSPGGPCPLRPPAPRTRAAGLGPAHLQQSPGQAWMATWDQGQHAVRTAPMSDSIARSHCPGTAQKGPYETQGGPETIGQGRERLAEPDVTSGPPSPGLKNARQYQAWAQRSAGHMPGV